MREAHAAARDAVRAEFAIESAFGADFVKQWNLFEVSTEARSKEEYLLRPDLGRRFQENSRQELLKRCSRDADIQIRHWRRPFRHGRFRASPGDFPPVARGRRARGWAVGQAFAIRYCRVGILNEIGQLLAPKVAILLIGERPGLATAESLSAYMAYRPGAAHTDANRNLISNIHSRGLSPQAAAGRILNLAAKMISEQASGFHIREQLPAPPQTPAFPK